MIRGSKGVLLPEANDDILTSFEATMNSAGIVVKASSIADARAMLAAAEAAGRPATEANPWYFDIMSVLYKATGSKGGNGIFDLKCMNEAELAYHQAGPSIAGTRNLGIGSYFFILRSVMSAQPYDRAFMAHGTVWCRVNGKGSLDVELFPDSKDASTPFRSRVNTADDGSTEVTGMGRIPANKVPDISLWVKAVRGADGNNLQHINFTTSSDTWTRLHIMAWPTSMY